MPERSRSVRSMVAFGRPGNPGLVRRARRNPGEREADCRASIGVSQRIATSAFPLFSRFEKFVRVRRFLLCACRGETERRVVPPKGKRLALDKGRVPVVKG